MSKPNIVFILADDMGYGDIGAFGNPEVETPALDRLASEGACLTQLYSGSPVCAPSRAALLTGRYSHRTGVIDTFEGRGGDRLNLDEVTLANMLKKSGYRTGLFGKWHLGALDPKYHPNARGFDEFAGFRGGWQDYYQWRLDRNGSFEKADGRYLTDVFTEEALGFIERNHTKPFFMHVTYNAPHFPFQAPDEDADVFRNTGKFTEAVSLIYGMNRRMDRGIERILAQLDRFGLKDNTIVIFASDNGPQLGGQGDRNTTRYNACFNGRKCLTYEGGIRVPGIVRWPEGIEAGTRIGEMMHFVDWFPTLLSIAGEPCPDDLSIDGNDISPLFRNEPADVATKRFWQWNRYSPVGTCNAAMRDGQWKLLRPVIEEAMTVAKEDIDFDRRLKYDPESVQGLLDVPEPERHIPDPPAPLLFDMDKDPHEQNDLAGVHPEIVARMQNELDEWFHEVNAWRG